MRRRGAQRRRNGQDRRENHRERSQKTSSEVRPDARVKPYQSAEVRKLLEGIGTPPAVPFKPDPFQLEALAALEFEDVLVTAPTGSGKTWIAREEIKRLLEQNRKHASE